MSADPDIFLSYNREDAATAKLYAEAFQAAGFNVWWDVDLRSGEAYDEVTENALRTAKAVVVLWSPRSVASRWVRAEATLADRNKTMMPVTIEACDRPIMFELVQTADLSHWDGDAADKAWAVFLGDVRKLLGKDGEAVVPVLAPALAPLAAGKKGEEGGAPALAVLPFANRSGLAEDDDFAEDLFDDVIDALSQGVNVKVRSGSATARLRGSALPDLDDLAQQLGVRYFLEGNVRRSGSKMRVTAQLTEAASGEMLWSQKFATPIDDLAELQDDLVAEVAGTLDTKVYQMEMERAMKTAPEDLTAWQAVQRALVQWGVMDSSSFDRAIVESEHAVSIAPDYGLGHAMLGCALGIRGSFPIDGDYTAENVRGLGHINTAVRLGHTDAQVLTFAALGLVEFGEPERSIQYAKLALKIRPGAFGANAACGNALLQLHQWDESIAYQQEELRISPNNHINFSAHMFMSMAHMGAGRWEEAEQQVDMSRALHPNTAFTILLSALLFMRKGMLAEAKARIALLPENDGPVAGQLAHHEQWLRHFCGNHPVSHELVGFSQDLSAALAEGG